MLADGRCGETLGALRSYPLPVEDVLRCRLSASLVTLCLAASACSERVIFLPERCDDSGDSQHPDLVPIVSLAKGEFVLPANVSRMDDRWLMTISTYPKAQDLAGILDSPPSAPFSSPSAPVTTRTELSEPCGDSRTIVRDLRSTLYWPYGPRVLNASGVPLPRSRWTWGVRLDGGRVVFDARSGAPPQSMPGSGTAGQWNGYFVGIDEGDVFLWKPGTPSAERRVLFEGADDWPSPSVTDEAVFLVDEARRLHVVELESGKTERLAENVAALWRPSQDGRFILALLGEEDPYRIVAFDREAGTEQTMTRRGSSQPPLRNPFGAVAGVRWSATEGAFFAFDEFTEETLLISYPGLHVRRLPGLWEVVSAHLDGHALFLRHAGSTYRLGPSDEGPLYVAELSAEMVYVEERIAYVVAADDAEGSPKKPQRLFDLYRVALDEGRLFPERLIEDSGLPLPLGDHRWAYTRAYEGENLGDLMLFDAVTGEKARLASDVVLFDNTTRFSLWTERNAQSQSSELVFKTSPPGARLTLWHYDASEK